MRCRFVAEAGNVHCHAVRVKIGGYSIDICYGFFAIE